MLAYRHAFHAGNHADVLKHLVLCEVLRHMAEKDKPFSMYDTHAGAGGYSLQFNGLAVFEVSARERLLDPCLASEQPVHRVEQLGLGRGPDRQLEAARCAPQPMSRRAEPDLGAGGLDQRGRQ